MRNHSSQRWSGIRQGGTALHEDRDTKQRQLDHSLPLMYAVWLPHDGMVKIGHTTRFIKRMELFKDREVLAVKLNQTISDEQLLHDELASERAKGREYYYPTARILDVVNEWRRECHMEELEALPTYRL